MNIIESLYRPFLQSNSGTAEIFSGIVLSIILNFIIAIVYRATYRGVRYSQDYVQTLILIGVVTTILITVVNGNGPIAFGMFAAFSVIRFRRTLGQSRDLAFVLFAMAVGMVIGARLYVGAIGITLLVSLIVVIMVKINAFKPSRSSYIITLRTTSDVDCESKARPIVNDYSESCELLSLASTQAGMSNEIRYGIQMRENASVASLLEKLLVVTGNNRVVIQSTSEPEAEI